MLTYFIRRVAMILPVLLGVTLMVFIIAQVTPGDPAELMLGTRATPENVERLQEQLGLNDPVIVQYARLIWNALHGNLGVSYRGQKPVLRSILSRFGPTAELAGMGLFLTVITGIPAGMIAARNHGKWLDKLIQVLSTSLLSVPVFWLAILIMYIFGIWLNWFDISSNEGISDLIMPGICMAISPAALLTRLTRASILEVLGEDYVRTARSKGMHERLVMVRHVLRNAFIPIITYLGLITVGLLTGAVFIESVFARSGLGRFMINAITARDYPEIQGAVIFTATLFTVINLLIDLLYAMIDPRIRYT